ncbi:MAG: cobalamin biosynthesis protein CbiD [Oscillospiraceae bacterium]|nr:cobalamin biosynthesis protein CbiD [Oscillospiraceae bacterium]
MDRYVTVDGKQMRLGYTTGSCAAAASKAAAYMLLAGRSMETVKLLTPKGIPLELSLREVSFDKEKAVCAVEKDGGDDPDVTTGALIYAEVTYSDVPGVDIDGGVGVGRVTKPGLDQPVGNAAINSTPRRMIRENVEEVCRLLDYHGGLKVVISAPAGVELAKKTFNPRLGIQGGISILGTTGIVEPMSESALVETIRVELRQRRAEGAEYALLTPGNYGADFLKDSLQVDWKRAVLTSNFIGDSLDACREFGFRGALLVGHVGKLVKISGNMLNTHSKWGDCRVELLAAHAGAAGMGSKDIAAVLDCVSCDEALRIIREAGLWDETLERLTAKVAFNLRHRAGEEMEVGTMLFSNVYGLLSETPNARTLMKRIMEG